MRKETNETLSTLTRALATDPIDLGKASVALTELICIVDGTESDLKDCVNELCLKCGRYREEHLGACSDCRWKEVKDGFYQD
jgi:hypothetical protein